MPRVLKILLLLIVVTILLIVSDPIRWLIVICLVGDGIVMVVAGVARWVQCQIEKKRNPT